MRNKTDERGRGKKVIFVRGGNGCGRRGISE